MNRKIILKSFLELIFLVIFNVAFFLLGGVDRLLSVWISYLFITLSYITIIGTKFIDKIKVHKTLGLSAYTVSVSYFIIEFFVGLFFILLKLESWKWSFIIQLILLGVYCTIIITVLLSNENTLNSIDRQKKEVFYLKKSSEIVKSLIGKLDDKKANKAIESVYDLLSSSPSYSNQVVYRNENTIVQLINDLQDAAYENDVDNVYLIADNLKNEIKERNRLLKIENYANN